MRVSARVTPTPLLRHSASKVLPRTLPHRFLHSFWNHQSLDHTHLVPEGTSRSTCGRTARGWGVPPQQDEPLQETQEKQDPLLEELHALDECGIGVGQDKPRHKNPSEDFHSLP